MANTTWVTLIRNESNTDIHWIDGEDTDRNGVIRAGYEKDFEGSGFCFPWVDYTKDGEISKAIEIRNNRTKKLIGVIFQSYNRDTIQWLKDPATEYPNNAVDVPGPASAGGKKAIIFQDSKNPNDPPVIKLRLGLNKE